MGTAQSTPLLETRVPFLIRGAVLVSFFPCGIFYPLKYPVREIATLLIWICAFPSVPGRLSLLLLPFLMSSSYGYSAFNLFCILGTLGTGWKVATWVDRKSELAARLHRLARVCMLVSLVLAGWQAVDGKDWLNIFPAMYAIGNGRGSGMRTEPSLLAAPLAIYLALVLWRRSQLEAGDLTRTNLTFEAAALGSATLCLTRSLSVAIILVCFLPAFAVRLRYLARSVTLGTCLVMILFWNRISDALADASTFADLITTSVGSWRNIPDIVILANIRDYLLPPNPANARETLNLFTAIWNPAFAWLDNTYSAFSASASTLGILITTGIFLAGLVVGYREVHQKRHLWITWILLYVADWFVLPKYEVSGWVATAMLTALFVGSQQLEVGLAAASATVSA